MNEKIHLIIKPQEGGAPIAYQCSSCGRSFILPDTGTPKVAATELWNTFKKHVQKDHPEIAES
jgi:hypothetical protein